MVSTEVATAEPADVDPCPVLASAFMKALRAAAALALAAVIAPVAVVLLEILLLVPDAGEPVKAEAGKGVTAGETCATGDETTVPTIVAAVTLPAGALVVAVPAGVAPDRET
jgi:hypothetical protein